MKTFIATQIRHIITLLAGLFTFFIQHGLLTADEADPIVARIDGFADVLAPIVAVIVTRAMMLAAVHFKAPQWIKDLLERPAIIVVCMTGAALASAGLVSCSALSDAAQGINYTGTAIYRHESGAKAGLDMASDGSSRLWFKAPWPTTSSSDNDAQSDEVIAAK